MLLSLVAGSGEQKEPLSPPQTRYKNGKLKLYVKGSESGIAL